MTSIDSDVRALRDALVPAVERDLARSRRRRPGRRLVLSGALSAAVLAGTGVAAATGIIFAEPKPDPAVPPAAEWMYFSHDPSRPDRTGPPVLMRPKPEAIARHNRATERELLERGITARCGEDKAHYLACYLPNGDPVPDPAQAEALAAVEAPDELESSRENYEIRTLTEEEARRWLCEHPEWRSDVPRDC